MAVIHEQKYYVHRPMGSLGSYSTEAEAFNFADLTVDPSNVEHDGYTAVYVFPVTEVRYVA